MKSNVQYKTKRTMGNRVLAYVYMLNGSEKKMEIQMPNENE